MDQIDITVVVNEHIAVSSIVDEAAFSVVVNGDPVQVNTLESLALLVENAEAQEIIQSVINVGIKGDKGDVGDTGPQGPQGPQGEGLHIDATGAAIDKSSYDTELENFSFLDTENDLLYFKASDTSGDWSDPVAFVQGPVGPEGPEGPAGADYTGPEIYAQPTEPVGAAEGAIWIQTSS